MPDRRPLRYVVAAFVFALGVLWLPGFVFTGAMSLLSAERNSEIEIDALAEPLPYTDVEAGLAARLLADGAVMTASPPIWDAPGDGGYFSVSRGASVRGAIDGAIAATRELRALLDAGGAIDSPAAVEVINRAQRQFDAVGEQQARDRGAVLYHRALLDIWRGNRASALDDLNRVIELIEEIERRPGNRLTNTQKRRLGGVRIATLYARALAHVSVNADDASRQAAIADLRAARDRAGELESLGASARGPFVELSEQSHLVTMSTAPIWNDLIVLLMRSGGGGSREALREVGVLVESPSYVQAHPTLASNLMALAAVGEGDASVEQRAQLASALGAPMRLPDETPIQAETRLRAAAVHAIVGLSLPDEVVPRPQRRTAVRIAFEQVFQGSPGFNRVDLPRVRGSAEELDSWLFIREWRRQLGEGALDGFQNSFDSMRDLPEEVAIDPAFFERWREEVNPIIERRIRAATQTRVQSAAQRRSLFRYAVIDADRPFLPRFIDALRYATPLWWLAAIVWLLTSYGAIALIAILRSARKAFEPTHYLIRTEKMQEDR